MSISVTVVADQKYCFSICDGREQGRPSLDYRSNEIHRIFQSDSGIDQRRDHAEKPSPTARDTNQTILEPNEEHHFSARVSVFIGVCSSQ